MCERPGVSLQTILHSKETRVPKIILQRVEELYPAVMESMVSFLCAENNCICVFIWPQKIRFVTSFCYFSILSVVTILIQCRVFIVKVYCEDASLLGCYSMLTFKWLPVFQRILVCVYICVDGH